VARLSVPVTEGTESLEAFQWLSQDWQWYCFEYGLG
jgi:hypothetical protein